MAEVREHLCANAHGDECNASLFRPMRHLTSIAVEQRAAFSNFGRNWETSS